MKTRNTTELTNADEKFHTGSKPQVPGLLVAYSPTTHHTVDRCRVTIPSFSVGRGRHNDLVLDDTKVSNTHFRIFIGPNGFLIEDKGSRNGTYLNGIQVLEPLALYAGSVIRAGRSVLVFEADAAPMLEPPPVHPYGMTGSFYVASIVKQLREAVVDGRHILLVGETGVGKELAAGAIASMMVESGRAVSVLDHNCAQYTSEEEADASLFGVGERVFSEVNCRTGLIEQAGDGLLFLDEADFLPPRIQKSLLRVIENKQYRRIGESRTRVSNARFVFASNNVEHSTFGLIHDLYPRLRVVRIPSLKERIADLPAIFLEMLRKSLLDGGVDEHYYAASLSGKHIEMMCLSALGLTGFRKWNNNVRTLKDAAKRLAAKAVLRNEPLGSVTEVFSERFIQEDIRPLQKPVLIDVHPSRETDNEILPSILSEMKSISHYEQHKNLIIDTYIDREKRLMPTVRLLTSQGVYCTRQHLARYLKKWGVRD